MRKIAVIGLGYAGLPVVVALARRFPGTIGFDCDARKIERLRAGNDPTRAVHPDELRAAEVSFTADAEELALADFFVIAAPTPIDEQRRPDLAALRDAAHTVGLALSRGDVVVLESTVFPGATEEVLVPALAAASGLAPGLDFTVGYSPERINPGDAEHGFEDVVKVIAADDAATLEVMAEVYGSVVPAGLHRAPSIRVAEAAKVIENVQRDLNIALVNELALLFDRMGIDTRAVLEAAGSKWNFHAYRPGLVGGHCIGVDPYYLTTKAQSIGFDPELILAGRRINDRMGSHVAAKTIKLLVEQGRSVRGARVAVLGLTFKPDLVDLRNSRVPDVVRELEDFGVEALVHDPLVSPEDARREYGIEPVGEDELTALDAVLLAVPHRTLAPLALRLVENGAAILVDVMWAVEPESLPAGTRYWRL